MSRVRDIQSKEQFAALNRVIRVGLIGNLILNKDMDGRELRKWIFGAIALWAGEAPTTKVGSVLGIFLK